MNQRHDIIAHGAAETLETRFALRVTATLNGGVSAMPSDISTRLRFAREKALARAQAVAVPAVVQQGGVAVLLGGWGEGLRGGWWLRLAAVLPLLALVAGLGVIQHLQQRSEIRAAADVDAALLADDVPPTAYSDPGFVEFLKSPRE